MEQGKLIIFSAPSGSGKTTIVKELLKVFPQFEFSISATSRAPRGTEQNGVDYFFLTQEEFRQKVSEDAFVEWEEVYNGTCYGTLKSEMERIWSKGNIIIFDVDVMGGINLKKIFGEVACSIFIMPPSVEVLRERLIGRATDSMETIEKRVAKAEFEISKAQEFDHVIVNDILSEAVEQTKQVISGFISKSTLTWLSNE
ncbi:MAG: guanylate kinase [Alistipes sp.]|nr:guanylate kinase [Alistipes sp.]